MRRVIGGFLWAWVVCAPVVAWSGEGPKAGAIPEAGPSEAAAPSGSEAARPANGAAGATAPAAEVHATLRVVVSGVESEQGHVLCALFTTRQAWLKDAAFRARGTIKGGRATCVFEGVPPGSYAASAFHDANDSGDLDKNFLGIPSEGVCASMGAVGRFGPPSFDDARFRVEGVDKTLDCVIP